jgi:hypothetical protein
MSDIWEEWGWWNNDLEISGLVLFLYRPISPIGFLGGG